MAKIKLSPLVSKISGSAGPLLFSESRGVATVRTKKTPSNPNTSAQQASRGALRDLMTLWGLLHPLFQGQWATFAATLRMTPINAFLAQNLEIENGNSEWSMLPPGGIFSVSASGIYESSACAHVSFHFTPGSIPSGTQIVTWHRLGNKPGPPGPTLTQKTFVGPLSSPVSVPVSDCGDGDNWIYANVINTAGTDWGFGFGVFVDII